MFAGFKYESVPLKDIALDERNPRIVTQTTLYAFWMSALFDTERFCRMIQRTPIDIAQWHRQQEIWEKCDLENKLKLGFSAYFLNRTNRSGIIEGAGPIGGFAQKGNWKIDVRLVKEKQIENLRALSRYASQIAGQSFDAFQLLARNGDLPSMGQFRSTSR